MILFQQVAICIPTLSKHDKVLADVEESFGTKIYSDSLRMEGDILGNTVDVDLKLSFDHGLFENLEVEFITSEHQSHWHKDHLNINGNRPFLSHFGSYLGSEDFDDAVEHFEERGFPMLQCTESYDHSNKRENGKPRHYQDVIFNTFETYGFNVKLTRKLS